MSDYEELRYEMQYYENEHYNELRKLEAEENASPTLKADRDAWKARAERAEARLKDAVRDFYQYAQGGTEICAYCLHDNECDPGETMCGATFKAFRWRGMREDEDGKI